MTGPGCATLCKTVFRARMRRNSKSLLWSPIPWLHPRMRYGFLAYCNFMRSGYLEICTYIRHRHPFFSEHFRIARIFLDCLLMWFKVNVLGYMCLHSAIRCASLWMSHSARIWHVRRGSCSSWKAPVARARHSCTNSRWHMCGPKGRWPSLLPLLRRVWHRCTSDGG